jgi:hypothetical protein
MHRCRLTYKALRWRKLKYFTIFHKGDEYMQMMTFQGFFKDGLFYQEGQITALPQDRMVIVNVLGISPPPPPLLSPQLRMRIEPVLLSNFAVW